MVPSIRFYWCEPSMDLGKLQAGFAFDPLLSSKAVYGYRLQLLWAHAEALTVSSWCIGSVFLQLSHLSNSAPHGAWKYQWNDESLNNILLSRNVYYPVSASKYKSWLWRCSFFNFFIREMKSGTRSDRLNEVAGLFSRQGLPVVEYGSRQVK